MVSRLDPVVRDAELLADHGKISWLTLLAMVPSNVPCQSKET
jgi:hypothetical protein